MQIDVAVIVSLITALAAIIAPVITAAINSKSDLTIKRMELFETNVNLSVAELAKGYSELIDNQGYLEPYWAFHTAAYKVMAQIPDEAIQRKLTVLLSQIRKNGGSATEETNKQFDAIILDISIYLAEPKKRK